MYIINALPQKIELPGKILYLKMFWSEDDYSIRMYYSIRIYLRRTLPGDKAKYPSPKNQTQNTLAQKPKPKIPKVPKYPRLEMTTIFE